MIKPIPFITTKVEGRDIPEVMRHHIGWLAIELARALYDHEPEGSYLFNVEFEVDFNKVADLNKARMTNGLAVISHRRLPEPDDEIEVKLTRKQLRLLHGMAAHAANKAEDRYIHTAEPECHAVKRQFETLQDAAIRLDNAEANFAQEKGE